jgi:hypothetical protein
MPCDRSDLNNPECSVICAACVPTLAALVIDAWGCGTRPSHLQPLQRLTALTELQVGTICDPFRAASMIGGITSLQSLRLCFTRAAWDLSWLTRLPRLTSLHAILAPELQSDPFVIARIGMDKVVSAVRHLPPSLRAFELTVNTGCRWPRIWGVLSSGAFAGLASASGLLQRLELGYMELPGNFMEVIQQLTRLTTLVISDCNGCSNFSGLTTLSGLNKLELWDTGKVGSGTIGSLKQLHTLRLSGHFLDGPYLGRLCAALPQLRVLDISSSYKIGPGVSALGLLTALEVVDLSDTVRVGVLERCLRVPPSLRRCHLMYPQPGAQQRAAATLGPNVEVVFRPLWKRMPYVEYVRWVS